MKGINYTPPATLQKFHHDPSLCRFVVGPLGSGKTFGMIMELVRRMTEQEPWEDGIRRTRFAIVRNTLPQLKQTVGEDIKALLGPLCTYRTQDSMFAFDFALADGTRVQSQWLLLPLERTEDQRRLLSLQLTGVWISEFREVEYSVVAAALGRVSRYPSSAMGGATWSGLIAESNPFSAGSDWYEHLVLNLPKDWSLYVQPGGMDPEAENRENLPEDYYERLIEGHSDEWVKVHVHGMWGDDLAGQAVFRNSFKPDFHVVKSTLQLNRTKPLLIGADWGRTPAMLIAQLDVRGRLLIFEELLGEDIGVEQFISEKLVPVLYDKYAGMKAHIIGDPAGGMKSQVSEESVFDVIRRLGFSVSPSPTNDIAPRLRAVEKFLLRQVDGGPALMIDRNGCPMLIRALGHDYRYKRKKTGDVEDRPDKNHPASDLADALQYLCQGSETSYVGRIINPPPRRQEVVPSALGWT